ncbi:MAG: sulfatase-like hydrolase/transferase [Planctomycetota bacterium]
MAERPNVIVCMCDELRWCGLGCYGHPTVRTPNLDVLAARGVRFETAISNTPICMPARSLLLSGQYARTCAGMTTNAGWPEDGVRPLQVSGFPQWPTARRRHLPGRTLPERMRDAGYFTSAVGKWHVEAWPDAVGFDHYCIPAHHHAHSAQWFCEDGGPVFSPPGYSVDYEAERVAGLIGERAEKGEPFFLYYNISPPHMPLMDAPEGYRTMYGRKDVVTRGNVPEGYEPDRARMLDYLWDYRHYRDELPYAMELPHDGFDLVDLHALYMGLTTWVDDAVGRMIGALESSGQLDNTVVVFTSDHGDNLGSHGAMGKGSFNDESLRVPMMVAGPGVVEGAVNAGQVASLLDLAPTCLGLAGIGDVAGLHGQDLGAVVRGEAEALERDYAIAEAERGCAVRTPNEKLSFGWVDHHPTKFGRRVMTEQPTGYYDLAADPLELDNLIESDGELGEGPERLSGVLREWDAATPWLKLEPMGS